MKERGYIAVILDWLFPYNPARNTLQLPDVQTKEKPRAKEMQTARAKETHTTPKSHTVFTVDKCDLTAQVEQTEWTNRAHETTRETSRGTAPHLTDEDINEMRARGILTDANMARAETIKPLWAIARSRSEIVEHFKGQKGYSDGSIGPILSCFSASLEKAVQNSAE